MKRLRTGKSSNIQGFTKIVELALVECLHWAIAINWLNVIYILLQVFTNNHKLLTLVFILDFIVTLWVVM